LAHPGNWAEEIGGGGEPGGKYTFVTCTDSLEVLQVVEVRLSSGMTVVEIRLPKAAAAVTRRKPARNDRA